MQPGEKKTTLRRIAGSYITSTISISLVLFMLGIIGLLILNAKKISDFVKENISFTIMIKPEAKEIDIISLQKEFDINPWTKQTEYITAAKALESFKKEMGSDFMQYLDENPLPPSIEVRLHANYANNDSIARIEKKYKDHPLVKEFVYQKSLVQQVNDNVEKISLVILGFGGLLLLIAIALINNTIRLSVHSKRFIIRTMQLVGATNGFIRRPFLWKSLIQSLIAASLSITMIIGLGYFIQTQTDDIVNLVDHNIMVILFAGLVVLGLIMNFLFSFFAVTKYLRMTHDNFY
jgi:cell division transport system permease protein